jgi:hypothetical protein
LAIRPQLRIRNGTPDHRDAVVQCLIASFCRGFRIVSPLQG